MPERTRARPPATLVAGVARRGAEEGKGSTGVLILSSPGLERQWSGGASVVKAAKGRAPVRVTSGSEMGQGGVGEEQWKEGMPGHPFMGSEGERGGRALVGNNRRWCCPIMVVEAAVSGGDRPGWWWGVMRVGGCSGRYGSGRSAGRWCERAHEVEAAATAVSLGRKMIGWGPCVGERGRPG
jgi:hypothetical protein